MSGHEPRPLVGAHISISGGHAAALRLAHTVGCEVVQIFTKNNMQWAGPPLRPDEIAAYRAARRELGYEDRVFAHAGYLINLAGSDETMLTKSRAALLDELERCSALELPFLVLHPGSHKGRGLAVGLAQIAASLDWIFSRYDGPTRIAFEFTAGQGDSIGRSIEEIAALLDSPHRQRLAICLDTCHLFAAGHDICDSAGLTAFVAACRQRGIWEKVVCVHLNDSLGALGSRLDRHAILGEGRIGWGCFEAVLRNPDFSHLPLCLETPKGENNLQDITTLARLKEVRKRAARSIPSKRRGARPAA